MAKFRIVGFDPASFRNLGWATLALSKKPDKTAKVTDWIGSTFVMATTDEKWQVLWPMFEKLDEFLATAKPHLVVVEKTSSFSGGFITGQVSQCMGVLLATCGKHKIPVEFVFPTSVKKLVAGHGRAKKGAVKKATKQLLINSGIKDVAFDSDHTADATASIFYWLIKNEIVPPLEEPKK